MLSNLNLKIKDIGPVNEVDIDIGKINVIGGLNATGKSTVSKLLYCILKGNVVNRQEFAYSLINPSLRRIVRDYRNNVVYSGTETVSDDEFIVHFNSYNMRHLSDEELLEIYEKVKEEILKNNVNPDAAWKEENELNQTRKIDRQIEVIQKNDNDLYFSILKRMLSSEFSSFNFTGTLNFRGIYNDIPFDYSIDLRNKLLRNSSLHSFFSISDVNYIDSISILDINNFRFINRGRNERVSHVFSNLHDDSEALEFLEGEFNEKIIEVEESIATLIKGRFDFGKRGFSFISDEGHETDIGDTSSGIKQIGIIQILLRNRKIKKDSFLIIDEPEVNLHPEWQIKFAQVLCMLSANLNVHIYINTHSPMFIEAMSIFSEYYYIKDETKFYLTKKLGKGFTFEKIANDDMGAVYENLSRPYDDLDDIKADILFRD